MACSLYGGLGLMSTQITKRPDASKLIRKKKRRQTKTNKKEKRRGGSEKDDMFAFLLWGLSKSFVNWVSSGGCCKRGDYMKRI